MRKCKGSGLTKEIEKIHNREEKLIAEIGR